MPKSKRDLPENEWSFFVKVEDVSDRPEVFSLEVDEESRAALARRFNIPSIESLCAQATVSPVAGAFHVTGHLKAKIVQSCIVTAEPVTSEIEEDFEGWFADRSQTISFAAAKKEREIQTAHSEVEILDESEDPEPVIGGRIDLGELAAQHLSLAIPPYPRQEGARYDYGDEEEGAREASPLRKNPFEALKDWKEKR